MQHAFLIKIVIQTYGTLHILHKCFYGFIFVYHSAEMFCLRPGAAVYYGSDAEMAAQDGAYFCDGRLYKEVFAISPAQYFPRIKGMGNEAFPVCIYRFHARFDHSSVMACAHLYGAANQ